MILTVQKFQKSKYPTERLTNLYLKYFLVDLPPQRRVLHAWGQDHHSNRWLFPDYWQCHINRIPGIRRTWCLSIYRGKTFFFAKKFPAIWNCEKYSSYNIRTCPTFDVTILQILITPCIDIHIFNQKSPCAFAVETLKL